MKSSIDISSNPIIAAVKSEHQLVRAIESECEIIFLLFGDILNISSLTQRISEAGKHPIVHIDLINGLAAREIAVDFIAQTTCAEGIISTRPALVRHANKLGLFSVLRVFALDSMALENLPRELEMVEPDVVEILPGLMPDIIRRVCASTSTPVIAGGLISSKREVIAALSSGAAGVSTTCESTWSI